MWCPDCVSGEVVHENQLLAARGMVWGKKTRGSFLYATGVSLLGFVHKGSSLCLCSFLLSQGQTVGGGVWELRKMLAMLFLHSDPPHLFFFLDTRALIIYFIFYNCSDLNCLHLSCPNLLINYRKV